MRRLDTRKGTWSYCSTRRAARPGTYFHTRWSASPRWLNQPIIQVASMARHDPLRNFRFRVEIDGIAIAGFSEAAIGATTTDVIDYREGNEPAHVRKLPGLTKSGNVTLTRA